MVSYDVGQKSIDHIMEKLKIYFFFTYQAYFFMLNQHVYFLIPFLHESLQLSRHKDTEVFRKIGISIFSLFVLLIFDHQDGSSIFHREVTIR